MNILLISTYELGRQPFGLASPAAWLRKRGHSVRCCDLSREPMDQASLQGAALIVFYLPMHTATRLALQWTAAIKAQGISAPLCACGLYASLNEEHLHKAGFSFVYGPEFESPLADLADALASGVKPPAANGTAHLPRLDFERPDRSGLPVLRKYAHLVLSDGAHRTAGYTEASRGCKHLCRHCPIVPVYSGQFRVVQGDVVLADIRQQVEAGAAHITFGDPDLFNGVTHALRIVEAMHAEFPQLTYDATIKIEHLLRHSTALPVLARTGCLLITSAAESLDDLVLSKLEKGHTRSDFFRALELCRRSGISLQPTFVPFTPWTTRSGYLELLEAIADHDLVSCVPPVQLAIRLLIPSRSRLLELPELAALVSEFDRERLVYPWRHPDPAMDLLADDISGVVADAEKRKLSRPEIFRQVWSAAVRGKPALDRTLALNTASSNVPFLSEPWYC